MKVFCPNCGSENDGLSGGQVVCRACTATFDVPAEAISVQQEQPQSSTPFTQEYDAPRPQLGVPIGAPMSVQPISGGAPTNTLAIVSLVSSLVCCAPVGLATGIIGLQQINSSGGAQKGKELAIIGIVLSALGVCSTGFYILAAIVGANG